jgi:hypothetical protein
MIAPLLPSPRCVVTTLDHSGTQICLSNSHNSMSTWILVLWVPGENKVDQENIQLGSSSGTQIPESQGCQIPTPPATPLERLGTSKVLSQPRLPRALARLKGAARPDRDVGG